MAHPAVPDLVSFFYPIGNTPAVCLTRDIPREIPAKILLLGCGDVRNILYTCYVDSDTSRQLDITSCDIQPAVIARNICLLSLILDSKDNVKAQFIWDIYYHLYLDKASLELLSNHAKKLVAIGQSFQAWKASEYGSLFRFCDTTTFSQVVKIWKGYITTDRKAREKFSTKLKSDIGKSADAKISLTGGKAVVLTGFRSASPVAIKAMSDLPKLHADYLKTGTTNGSHSKEANPMFDSNGTLHYSLDPLFGFHLAPAYISLAATSPLKSSATSAPHVVATARLEFKMWSDAFKVCAKNMVIRVFAGDALAFCRTLHHIDLNGNNDTSCCYRNHNSSSALLLDSEDYRRGSDGPLRFTAIDTSNLVDHLGPLNVMVAASPLLANKKYATLFTEILVQQEKNPIEAINNLLCGDFTSMSVLLGLSPVEYFTKATVASCTEEMMLNALSNGGNGKDQMLIRINWKRMVPSRLVFESSDLANMLYGVYLAMFPHENHKYMFSGGTSAQAAAARLQKSQIPHYHRGSFVMFLQLVESQVSTNWHVVVDCLLSHIENDTTLFIGKNYLQELYASLQVHGVYTVDTLKPGFGISRALSHSKWKSLPPLVCITLQIPKSRLNIFTDRPACKVGTHTFNCSLLSSNKMWQNHYAALQFCFGKATTEGQPSSTDYKVRIEEDEQGWHGKSPMLVSFFTPSWMLLIDGRPPTVSLLLQSSPQSLMMFSSVLGIEMKIFETSLADEANVFVTVNQPNMDPTTSLATTPSSTAGKSDQDIVKVTAHINPKTGSIDSFTAHADISSPAIKAALQAGEKVEIEQSSLFQVAAVIGGKHVVQLDFPMPVVSSSSKTRIARKSSYIEVIAPLLKPADHDSLAAFMHPMLLDEGLPVSLNMSRTNLDGMAIVDISQPAKIKWMHTHVSLMWSEREKALRLASMGIHDPPAPDLRVNFKDGLFSMFMRYTGAHDGVQQVPKGRIFGISDPKNGGIHIVIVVSALRLDGANGTIVLDAAAIPLTPTIASQTGPWISSIGEALVTIKVDEEELKLWKRLLPAYAERCRTWSHKKSCEYARGNSIPLSLEFGKSLLCTCGNGVFPVNFMQDASTKKHLPGWNTVAKYATRIAISPSFSVPMVEEQVGANLSPGRTSKGSSDEKNAKLEALSNLMGDQDKMRSFMKAMEEKQGTQGTSFNGQAAIEKGIEEYLRSTSKPVPAPPKANKERSEMEALEKGMAALIKSGQHGCDKCGKEKRESGEALLNCAQCHKAKYCSSECQKAQWKEHKKICGKDGD
ncbi:hypothetical protein EG327_009616 [Venturia inaequalis]|uniref:MYND-type domain-containing protein n=1 Tax=Venturia inaequalis TaxID=5025 RepID=A0A8H3VSN3_VENIN|nr:hypothetical protein EG327_009616 [Venturia inaequalis]